MVEYLSRFNRTPQRHWPRKTIPNGRPKAIAGMQNPLMLA
nr:MAG TPA: hypothetical protein [Caudoviricetes sp.]